VKSRSSPAKLDQRVDASSKRANCIPAIIPA
jgi:hypothetical protein